MAPTAELPPLLAALYENARRRPDRPAVVAPKDHLTHGALARRTDAVAEALVRNGVGAGSRVAIVGVKSAATVAGLMGILRSGAAYVPLDPKAPPRRVAALLADARCQAALGPARALEALEGNVALCLALDDRLSSTGASSLLPPVPHDAVAYCIYTSGSTGSPKGVQISHRAVAAFLASVGPLMDITPDSVCLNTSPFHFDVSVVDVLLPLAAGATVHLSGPLPLPSPILDTIERASVTHMAAVGSTVTLLAECPPGLESRDLSSLRRLMTGAEVLRPQSVQAWLRAALDLTVINGYGPTEATCLVTAYPITAREPGRTDPYPIGCPVSGTTIRFLTDSGALTEDGPGEILIAGPQLMDGYVRPPGHADDAEQNGPFLEQVGTRYYRTGDVGGRDAHGDIWCEGRRDDQVKVRGYRVNLNEVRLALEGHRTVSRACVVDVVDERGKQILAAVVQPAVSAVPGPGLGGTIERLPPAVERTLRDALADELPPYMIPREVFCTGAFPTLSSGKLDGHTIRSRLAELVRAGAGGSG